MKATKNRSRALIGGLATVVAATVLVATNAGFGDKVSAAEPTIRDGKSSTMAAPSCWDIKQNFPSSASGTYWLQTPKLVYPREFYCDMTTDGGGWVLIGRGRSSWKWNHTGQGPQYLIASTPTGVNAFDPAYYDAAIVDGLLSGTRPDALEDGIRVRRAKDAAGSTWQELRWKLAPVSATSKGVDRWSWAFGGGLPVASGSVEGQAFGATNTADALQALPNQNVAPLGYNGYQRWLTSEVYMPSGPTGFAYGMPVTGTTASDSYLLQADYALPFSQVFIRPKIRTQTYPAIAASGTAASTISPMLSTRPTPLPWGVATLGDPNDQFKDITSLVMDFAQIGQTIFVAGKYLDVQKASDRSKIRQSYLAAFNLQTGEWISTFRPTLNGVATSVEVVNGNLVVGGSFTSVNGAANTSGIAMLNPTTGAVVTGGWNATLFRDDGSGRAPMVTAMDQKNGWLYIGGFFTAATGGNNVRIGTANLARLTFADGRPDGNWRPSIDYDGFNSSVYAIEASPTDNRVWVSGWFSLANRQPARNVAAFSTVDGSRADPPAAATYEGTLPFVPEEWLQQWAMVETDGKLWLGGSQHSLQTFRTSDFAMTASSITNVGGDLQTIVRHGNIIYAGCHCSNYNYEGGRTWDWPFINTTQVTHIDKINTIGAWDVATGKFLPEFLPQITSTGGQGPFASFEDSRGCVWFGGDFDKGAWNGGGFDFVAGFARFCDRDTTAPTTPPNVRSRVSGNQRILEWDAATDNAGRVRYEVIRNDRVIGTVWSGYFSDTTVIDSPTYYVRAVDESDNRSASSTAISFNNTPASTTTTAAGATTTTAAGVTTTTAAGTTTTTAAGTTTTTAGGTTTTTAPAAFTATATKIDGHGITVTWVQPAGGAAIAGYSVLRDGVVVAFVGPTVRSFSDLQLPPGKRFTYTVVSLDVNGVVRTSNTTSAATDLYTPNRIGWPVLQADNSTWSWTPNAPFARYEVSDNGTVIATPTTNSTTLSLAAGTHQLTVTGIYADGTKGTTSLVTTAQIAASNTRLTGVASNSTLYGAAYPPSNVLDGNNNTVTATLLRTNSWIQIDLGSVKSISRIEITGHPGCCFDRLANAKVLISDTPLTSDFATSVTTAKAVAGTLPSPALQTNVINWSGTGRYVRVSGPVTSYMNVAEFKVFAGTTPTVTYPA